MSQTTPLLQYLEFERGWKTNGPVAIGRQDGYWFTVTQTGVLQPILVTASLAGLQHEQLEPIKQFAQQLRKQKVIHQFSHANHVLQFVVQPRGLAANNQDRVVQLLQALSGEFKRLEMVDGCHFCATPEPSVPLRVGDKPAVACKDCQTQLQERAERIRDKRETQGNYITGFVGALLGALIGAAVWVGVARLGYYAAIIGFVMAYLAQLGYRLLKGRIQKGMPLIILLCIVFGMFAATTVDVAIGLVEDPNIGLSLAEALRIAPQAFYNNEWFYVGLVWKEVLTGLVFAGLGSFSLIRKLFREVKGETYEVVPL